MAKQVPFINDIATLKPAINEIGFDMHYNGVYNNYIEAVNNNEGDIPFNRAGEYLHRLYFENIRDYRPNNQPIGKSAQVRANQLR